MGRGLGYCIPCGQRRRDVPATVVIDGDPLCDACARDMDAGAIAKVASVIAGAEAEQESAPEPRLCSRGCGEQAHRGLCKGQKRPPAAERARGLMAKLPPAKLEVGDAIVPLTRAERGVRADRLVAEEINVDDVPEATQPRRHPQGRIGELWERFLRLAPGRSLKVKCRTPTHVASTDRELAKKAAKAGLALESRRVGADYYCWKGKA